MSVQTPGRALARHSIAWRLGFGLGAVFVVIGLVSAICLWALFDIHERLHALKKDEDRARSVVQLASAVRDQYAHVAHSIILGNESHAALFRQATRQLETLAAEVRPDGDSGSRSEVDRIVRASKEIERLFETEVLPLVRAGDRAGLVVKHERIMDLALEAQTEAEDLARRTEAAMDDLNQHVRATQHGAVLLTIIAHIVALATAVVVGLYLYRTIARPVSALSDAATRVGAGDLETLIVIDRDDELGRLSRRFNGMMTAVKTHQAKLLETERLVGLASMSAGIAHELNNPIGVIVGYAKLLRRGGVQAVPKVLAAIEEEAERCQQVIEGLLQLTRGGVLQMDPVDLRAVADDVIRRRRVGAPSPTVEFEIHGHASLHGDESKLRQVLTNLVENAIEACGGQGRVVVLIDEPRPDVVTVEVTDTGLGVPAAIRDRMFEPFFTTKATGSGLGLPISRAIARAHGGDVTVASTSDRGTTFRLTLPGNEGTPS